MKKEGEKSNIFDEAKKEKQKAISVLELAKEQEQKKMKQDYRYVTSTDGKTKTLRK